MEEENKEGKKTFVVYTQNSKKFKNGLEVIQELRFDQCSKPNTSGISILSLCQVNGVQALGYLTIILCIILFERK
jgi:hypothetical protein